MKLAASLPKNKIRSIFNFVNDIAAVKYKNKIREIRERRRITALKHRRFSYPLLYTKK